MSGLEKTVVNSSDVVPLGSDHNGRNITPPASCMQMSSSRAAIMEFAKAHRPWWDYL
jgi:hypothetical protein